MTLTLPRQRTSSELQELALDAGRDLDGALPHDVLRWAWAAFGKKFCVTSSMGDAVLATLASDVLPSAVDVIFLDTGYHFPQTLQTRDRVARTLNVNVVSVRPELTVAQQNVEFGQSLYARDPDACCAMRKVAPLNSALQPYLAWGAGLRRDESPSRSLAPVVGWDAKRGKVKVNPLACWTADDVSAYIAERDVIVNPLAYQGFPSIGCAPCTKAVLPGQHARAGRWAGRDKTECGLHV
ncbi:phosphoadenylyl-sulfate reductase [Fodinicola feengrottensis]|uniref:Adenosine 5'-phosphosulfate reductase n=1 Tax=Fodinicola feengrottensis TaxID=435914 RepID=A0ABN2HSA4_9ACTN